MIRTYSEAIQISDFLDRFHYLQLHGEVGRDTFGFDRWLNQRFYHDPSWRKVRNECIIRDEGCDLAHADRPIYKNLIVHHIDPITKDDVVNRDPKLFDLNNLICVSSITHRALHYGDEKSIMFEPIVRAKNDMCPWR